MVSLRLPDQDHNGGVPRIAVTRCLVAAVLFGASAPAASKLAGEVPTFTLAGLLYLGAGLAVTPTVLARRPDRDAIVKSWRLVGVAVAAGGIGGPVLLVAGLARTDAATASILLNLELAATVLFAATLLREHLGGRLVAGAAIVTAAGVILVWDPRAGLSTGDLFIAAACLAWGLDNGVTARIDTLSAEHVVFAKGVIAGVVNLAVGIVISSGLRDATPAQLLGALAIGAVGYGLSITLWVKGARDLGAARGQVIFATAPFIGAVIAWAALGESIDAVQIVAIMVAAIGVALATDSAHEHRHSHRPFAHDHEHSHDDDHHRHVHDQPVEGGHSHPHHHGSLVHTHPHFPDLHHRHDHN